MRANIFRLEMGEKSTKIMRSGRRDKELSYFYRVKDQLVPFVQQNGTIEQIIMNLLCAPLLVVRFLVFFSSCIHCCVSLISSKVSLYPIISHFRMIVVNGFRENAFVRVFSSALLSMIC